MSDTALILAVRAAGAFHLVTLVAACFTPIPANWNENLARLPESHRRFAVAQNFSIGATIAFCGIICLFFAPTLIDGSVGSRIVGSGIALLWGGRVIVLQWLSVWQQLSGGFWKTGFVLLQLECVAYALGFGWLALR
jgi:hypothetical protein